MSDFRLIENKWQKYWATNAGFWQAGDDFSKSKKYILVEFPYPSGSGLHIGHTFSFTGADVYARFQRMLGYNVMFPMGWDAFGLPTENYAIKMKRKPQEITKENTDNFRSQMKRLAFSFDWEKEINTTDPKYYKWTQWIFIQLFKKGLARKQEMPINWCPSCKIGLANEEVVEGKCERCGTEVSRRNISQWVVKITDYADKLIEGLKETEFIEKVKQQQINWIGKSEGARIRFKISDDGCQIKGLEVFTTRPETLFGATFMVIAPEHPLVGQILDVRYKILEEQKEKIKEYVINARKKSDMERTELAKGKSGVFSGLYAVNPVDNKQIPIWISDFVLASYGTGAIMSVPAHDERDEAFAKKFKLSIVEVVDKKGGVINSGFLNGLKTDEAKKKMIKWLEEKKIGERAASYHLRDWIFSRQHYWGEPIPMIHCHKCAMNQVQGLRSKILDYAKKQNIDPKVLENNPGWYPDNSLPIVLPEVEAYEPTDDGKSPLSKIESFVKCRCPVCGEEAERETDTMPNWAGSDWYYLAYVLADEIKVDLGQSDIFSSSREKLEYWSPVDIYIGGDEHNVLHLLYSRFIYKFLWDLGVLPKKYPEPYFKRISHGVILGSDNQRMSKSRGNVIVPETVADKYGVDVLRMYLMFMGPFEATMVWNEKTLMGVKRFLDRFTLYIENQVKAEGTNMDVNLVLNKTIKYTTETIERFSYNTAIAKLMELLNNLSVDTGYIGKENLKKVIKLLAPLAPYTAEEMWSRVREGNDPVSVHLSAWPVAEEKYLAEEEISLPVAINGRVRSEILVDRSQISEEQGIMERAKADEKVVKWIGGSKIVKEIYVPGKMVNLVVQ